MLRYLPLIAKNAMRNRLPIRANDLQCRRFPLPSRRPDGDLSRVFLHAANG